MKEEPPVSESTSIVDLEDAEINKNERFPHPEGNIEGFDAILSCVDRLVAGIDVKHTDSEDEAPISLLKNKLGKTTADEIDTKNQTLLEAHCIPSNVKKKTDEKGPKTQETLDPHNIVGLNGEEITIKKEKIEEDSFHCQPRKNSTESPLFILDIVKEEPHISESTSDRHLTIIDTEYTDSEDDVPLSLLKGRLAKYAEDSHRNSREEITTRDKTTVYECEICDEQFSSKHDLKVHLDSHKENTQKCDRCGKEFLSSYSLRRHLERHDNPYPFECDKCGKFFAWNFNYNRHMEICKRRSKPQQLNGKKFNSKNNRNSHMGNQKRITHKCNQCDKKYYNVSTLGRHMKTHTNPKPYNCRYCGKWLATKLFSTRHKATCKRRIEHEIKGECDICGIKFTRKAAFDVHMENHMGFTLQCDKCGKEYKNSVTLKMHMKWHANPEKFQCEKCGKYLTSNCAYKRHMQICKGPDKPKPLKKKPEFICSICGKNFTTKAALVVHTENHQGITQKCVLCGKEFVYKYSLRRHLKWHDNPYPFECKKCGKFFAWKTSYNKHNCKTASDSLKEEVAIEKPNLHPEGSEEVKETQSGVVIILNGE